MLKRVNFVRPVNYDRHKVILHEDKEKYDLMNTHRSKPRFRPLEDKYKLPESTISAESKRRIHESNFPKACDPQLRYERLSGMSRHGCFEGVKHKESGSTWSSVAKCARRAADHLKRCEEADGSRFEDWLNESTSETS